MANSAASANLPIIDFSKFSTKEAASEKAKLYSALQNDGFIYLRGHGIAKELLDNIFAHAKTFFAWPESEKAKLETGAAKFFHGWFSPARTSGSNQFSDQKEAFDLGDDNDPSRPNQWPSDWPEFRTDLNSFFDQCHSIHLDLLAALAEQVGLPPDYFNEAVEGKGRDHFFRILHYPETTAESFKSRVRAGTHTDYGTLTLLFNDNSGGLQVRGKDGNFFDAPPIEGAAIVNGQCPSHFVIEWNTA
jgi:isopenicillin N synthase-like dioxygenase